MITKIKFTKNVVVLLLSNIKLEDIKVDNIQNAQDAHLGIFDEVFKNVSPKFIIDKHSKIIAKRLKGYSKKYIILFKPFPQNIIFFDAIVICFRYR